MIILAIASIIIVWFVFSYIKLLVKDLYQAEYELARLKSDNNMMRARIELYERGRKNEI